MSALLIALVVFALVGIVATAALRRLPAAQNHLTQGLAHLAGLRWYEFTRLVLQAMQARGYRVLKHDNSHGDDLPSDGGDILLERDGQRVLLLCKYGNASVVGAQSILGLGKAAELRGAHAAMVVTPGRFDDEARRVAGVQRVELIDGASLWPEVEPFVGQAMLVEHTSTVPDLRKAMIAWLGAAAVGAITWLVLQGMSLSPPAPATTPAATPVSTILAPPAGGAAASPAQGAAAIAKPEAVPTDPVVLERRRNEIANAISTLAGVDRAVWTTQSTLQVHLAAEDVDPIARLCPLLERYPELAASRVQLQPPQGSTRPVRFKQCRTY